MREQIDCFLPHALSGMSAETFRQWADDKAVGRVVIEDEHSRIENGLASSEAIREVERQTTADYVLICTKATRITLGQNALHRMLTVARERDAALVYSDHYSTVDGQLVRHPVTDYQEGSVRDDFDFGALLLIKASGLHEYIGQATGDVVLPDYQYAALYDLRLFLSRNKGVLFHLNEYLYTEEELDLRKSGEKQFDYVDPRNREVQLEMEKALTFHLRSIGAWIDPVDHLQPDFNEQEFPCEASVIIPVLNREQTVADAVKSALSQKTSFPFNVIVINNHSTDRTGEILEALMDSCQKGTDSPNRLIQLIPQRKDLGIGGCWNEAVNSKYCGKFAVQLDSDDLYASSDVLQRIVDAFYQQKAAMVIGSYRMCNFQLKTLPPGLIDHREWSEGNGCNNALRINGLGAPRAFFTPILRQLQFPNTSYGEDYAVGLTLSRRYCIGRIYDELYLCRRWDGNSDADLSVEKVNAHHVYKDRLRTLEISARKLWLGGKVDLLAETSLSRFFDRQLEVWPEAKRRYRDLKAVQTRILGREIRLQFNPARMVSTGARIDSKALGERPCFLCQKNRPQEQMTKALGGNFQLLVNPFPILPIHFTLPGKEHRPQRILGSYPEIHRFLSEQEDMMVFYNGPECGASAPDHLHLQAGTNGLLPLQNCWPRLKRNLEPVISLEEENEGIGLCKEFAVPFFVIKSRREEDDERLFHSLYHALETVQSRRPSAPHPEPMMNIIAWKAGEDYLSVVIPRRKHRPDCYFAEGNRQVLVSPGALDMAGLIITPREEDFRNLALTSATAILQECGDTIEHADEVAEELKDRWRKSLREPVVCSSLVKGRKEPEVSVGIVSAEKIHFILNGTYMAKGVQVQGEQTVEFSEGGILWRGTQYCDLTFRPIVPGAFFSLDDVTIGVNFHWERKETQTFLGTLKLVVEESKICAIDELPVEQYLESVISSEMSATSSLELLKAHAVISRSWLLAQMEKRRKSTEGTNSFFSFIKKDNELIRWYDREDHTIFDVCADDHCQRYQGITKETFPRVAEAVRQTRGMILVHQGVICDARFSKCCGGVTEEFQYCWEDVKKPYLSSVRDLAQGEVPSPLPDLTIEANADQWIRSSPKAFCNTKDRKVLSQVLNDYDQETTDFYRWQLEYTQRQLQDLLKEKLNVDLGNIKDLVPVERGKSGRISKLSIIGQKGSFTVGKELEIRRVLSKTHLYSSAFVVDKLATDADGVPGRFRLLGAGWGHGVGLCQIGAAVMGERGYSFEQILLHYYRGAEITKIYR